MVTTPVWQPAVAGTRGTAGHVNQFLGGHESTISYGGTLQSAETTGSSVYSDTYTQWLGQQIVTSANQTTIGYLLLQLSDVGGSPTLATIPPLTVSLYADVFGVPGGSLLASAGVTCQYVYSSPYWVTVPLAAAGLSPGTSYQIVTTLTGSSSHYYVWQRSTTAGGASTSPDGLTWTSSSFGLMYQVFDQIGGGSTMPLIVNEDTGLRVTSLTYDTSDQLGSVSTYTTGSLGTFAASATLTYTNGLITGVS